MNGTITGGTERREDQRSAEPLDPQTESPGADLEAPRLSRVLLIHRFEPARK